MRDVDRFFYVSGNKPSNLPNSFVVSKEEAEFGTKNSVRTTDRFRLNDINWNLIFI